ncbi:MAG: GDP-mannose 4,6-dehydratase [Patescibacteria group bacterium]
MKKALVTGCTGQDGSYLCELLLSKGYEVHGFVRHTSQNSEKNIEKIRNKIKLVWGDLSDYGSIFSVVNEGQYDEIYNLGALAHVGVSFREMEYAMDVTGVAPMKFLEAIRLSSPHTKFYQASSSEQFGGSKDTPYNEHTPFLPNSPYAIAKVAAHNAIRMYREAYGLHASAGIFFNHESERRPTDFVTRKITTAVAKIVKGKQDKLRLGNIEAWRDWGYSPEYMEAIWLIMQQEKPDDYCVCTGEVHQVKDFIRESFKIAGIENWEEYVEFDKKQLRPLDVDIMHGNNSKIKEKLGWEPKIKFAELVKIMTEHDLQSV